MKERDGLGAVLYRCSDKLTTSKKVHPIVAESSDEGYVIDTVITVIVVIRHPGGGYVHVFKRVCTAHSETVATVSPTGIRTHHANFMSLRHINLCATFLKERMHFPWHPLYFPSSIHFPPSSLIIQPTR